MPDVTTGQQTTENGLQRISEPPHVGSYIDGNAELVSPLETYSKDTGREIACAYERANRGLRDIVYCGCLMLMAKEKVRRGQFATWLKAYAFPNLPESAFKSAWRKADMWMKATERIIKAAKEKFETVSNLPMSGFPKLLQNLIPENGEQRDPAQAELFDYIDGLTLREVLGDKEKGKGGFRPNEKEVAAWLRKHHPELKGTKYADLDPAIQKEFRRALRHGEVKRTNPQPEGQEKECREQVETLINMMHQVQSMGMIGFIQDDLLTRLEEERLSLGRMIKGAMQARKLGEHPVQGEEA